jgi:hypothetical protein
MTGVDAAVDDRDGGAGAARDGPGLGRVDVGVGGAADAPDALADVVQAPLQALERVGAQRAARVALGPDHVRVVVEVGQCARGVAVRRVHDLEPGDGKRLGERDIGVVADVGALGRGEAGCALEDDAVRGGCRGSEDAGEDEGAGNEREKAGH